MSDPTGAESDPDRLEQLWRGAFGDDYVDRNASSYGRRSAFWNAFLSAHPCERILEVGCNVGGNLRWIAGNVPTTGVYGVDINEKALACLKRELPTVNAEWSMARALPYRDAWFDMVFTMGVLIHQPDTSLPLVMAEMVRCSRKWVFAGEYFSEGTVEVPYRGHQGALMKRNYGKLFGELFPELQLVEQGFLAAESGWDDVTWWLFEKRGPRHSAARDR